VSVPDPAEQPQIQAPKSTCQVWPLIPIGQIDLPFPGSCALRPSRRGIRAISRAGDHQPLASSLAAQRRATSWRTQRPCPEGETSWNRVGSVRRNEQVTQSKKKGRTDQRLFACTPKLRTISDTAFFVPVSPISSQPDSHPNND
jgi:hypothetical protein